MNKEFNWGETPAIIVARLDHYLSVPCWFDEVGQRDIHPTVYDSLGLDEAYRTDRLKKYHAFDALFRQAWLRQNIASTIGHMLVSNESNLWIIVGYPRVFLSRVYKYFGDMYKELLSVDKDTQFLNGVHFHPVNTVTQFDNSVSAAKALAEDEDKMLFIIGEQSFTTCLPEIDFYHEAIQEFSKREMLGNRMQRGETPLSEPLTQEAIDALLYGDNDGNDDDDGNDGGIIQ